MLRVKSADVNALKMPLIKGKEKTQQSDQDIKQQAIVIEPDIIKFSGFEVGKLNVLKVRIINRFITPQRIQVIPPKTTYFNMKYDKRGMIPPGGYDELFISLKPPEYKFYQDLLRVNTQQEQIVVQILAFPAINRDYLRDLFPRYLDFGTLEIGEQFSQRFPIQNKVPLNFDFEFHIIKDNFDFKIIPLSGVIPEKGIMDIEIIYKPSINVTVYMEVQLIIGSRDFEPLPIKLMGTGKLHNDKIQHTRTRRGTYITSINSKVQQKQQNAQQIQKDLHSSQENLDEQSLLEYSPQVIYEAAAGTEQIEFYPIIKPKEKRIRNIVVESEIVEIKQGVLLQGRQIKEKQYLEYFNQIANLGKEKENKLKQFIGDHPIKENTISEILSQRDQFNQQFLASVLSAGVTRYQLQLDIDNSVADQILPKYECSWNSDKNDVKKIRRLKKERFRLVVTRVIYRIRFDNRIQKIRAFLKGATKKEEVEKLVNQDWQKAEYSGIGKKEIVLFSFEFEENCIGKFELPVQHEETNAYSQFKFDVNPRTGFDDWAPIEQIPSSDQEIMQYKNWEYPQLVYHPPLQNEILIFRDGAEEEIALRGKMGPIQSILISSQKEEILRNYMGKPQEGISFILPHKTMRFYYKLERTLQTESNWLLNFKKCENLGSDLDPNLTTPHFIFQQELSNRQPGYNSLNLLYELKIDHQYYQERNMQLAYDYGNEEFIEQYCQYLMADKEPDDYITDDSDEERPPLPQLVDSKDFLAKIELDDRALSDYKNGDIIDQYELIKAKIDRNLIFEKNKLISTIPSKTNDYNKFINQNGNKLIIL